ncbi:MAG: glycerate kinase, partial [Stackebrandtia sp.]
ALAAGLARGAPDADIRQTPVADGGDGTVAAFVAAGWEPAWVDTVGPTGMPTTASYAVRGKTAVIELADSVGLVKLPGAEPDPMYAGTYGLGVVIGDALDRGFRDIVLGLGGSASSDGGAGMLQALGLRILDGNGNELPRGAAPLAEARKIEYDHLHAAISETSFVLASDVDNPLLGPHGAVAVFAPQKGANPRQSVELEAALTNWAHVVADDNVAPTAGAGAAGGTGFGAMAVLRARARSGIELILELIDFTGQVRAGDLVITGEGALDEQTLRGKAPAGVAATARAAGAQVVAVAGRCTLATAQLGAAGFSHCYTLAELEPVETRSIAAAARLLEEVGVRIAADFLR